MTEKTLNFNALTEDELIKLELASGQLGKRLKYLRELAHCNREEAANFARVKYSTYKAWENGKASPAKTRAHWLVDELQARGIQCTADWLLEGQGELPSRLKVTWDNKVITSSSVEAGTIPSFSDEESRIKEEVEFFCRRYPNSIGFVVPDDSMLPTYSIGDVVAGIQLRGKDIEQLIGHNCILELANGSTILRNLQAGQQVGKFALLTVNPNTSVNKRIMYDIELVCAASVVWHRVKIV